jgi:hypothetical protein
MTAAATPRGRPQYAAPRDEIASSASGGRKNNRPPFPENYRLAEAGGSRDPLGRRCSTSRPRNCSAQQFLSARLFPHSRLVETGGRRHPRRRAGAERHRPRASATVGTTVRASCIASVITGAVGRRRFRRGVAMPSTCTSTTAFSPEWPVKRPVGALRDLQEHPEGVLLGFSQPNLNRACRAKRRVAASGKSYELCRVARAAWGGGDSRDP